MKKQEYIGSLTGLKVVCMLLIFWWHSTIPKPMIDLGARSCECLFVASGFLVGYNSFYKEIHNPFKMGIEYWFRKFLSFWPLHVLVTMGVLFYFEKTAMYYKKTALFYNLTLLQAWSSDINISLSFNGASWFLSALLFCYFMSPFLLKCCRKVRASVPLFVAVLILRDLIERGVHLYSAINTVDTFLHTNPAIRCMEYFLGMLLVPLFLEVRESLRQRKVSKQMMTIWEVLAIFAVCGISYVITIQGSNQRSYFVLMFTGIVFLFALDGGYVSQILGAKPFLWFSGIQFEFFILHQAIIRWLGDRYTVYFSGWKMMNLIMFLTVLAAACVWKGIWSRCLAVSRKMVKSRTEEKRN